MIAVTQQSTRFWGASFSHSSGSTRGFSPQAIFKEGITTSFPGNSISTYVCFLVLTHSFKLCIHADRFVRGIEFHNTTIVAPFAREKKDFCKI